ncbi:gametogenetin-binding protein 2-like isoform X2 [Nilaparvata lugens]|uniref:gametogenetin-binding protein 2-like isoform X2 n=1 Tax=Nilaparvata lugens TaxID=108931 RepID=UPI000B99AEC6|nr:gametogenetin-binding protein 2-like isoform X2 [Nilaparvata lugens]
MAKLVDVYRDEKQVLRKRQLPLAVDESLTMVMDLSSMGFVYDNPPVRGKELEEFKDKFYTLAQPEVKDAFQVNYKDMLTVLDQTIPCVGCRRSVERLFCQLCKSEHPALSPLIVTKEGNITVSKDHFDCPILLCSLLHGHSSTRLNDLVEGQLRSKKSRRCVLHSLDSHRTRALTTPWRDIWSIMRPQCRDEVVLIEAATLMATVETYLRKHRFCGECRTKVLRAYSLLMEESGPVKDKGYVPELYANIKRCTPYKHIHLQTKTDYIHSLIRRAELELVSRRERHAKTLEIAQEEVLTCLGICVYERLHRIQLRLKEEECTCQVLAAVAIDSICRNFEVAVERKRGKSHLELFCEEITKEEKLKQQRKEHKKLKKKKRKEKKANLEEKENFEYESEEHPEAACEQDGCTCCDDEDDEDEKEPVVADRQKLQVLHRKIKGPASCNCIDCQQRDKKKKSGGQSSEGAVPSAPTHTAPKEKKAAKGGKAKEAKGSTRSENNNNKMADSDSISIDDSHNSHALTPCQSCANALELLGSQNSKIWSSDQSQDCGYSSENNISNSIPSSTEGSEVACSDGFCNHEGDCHSESGSGDGHNFNKLSGIGKLSLQQMLEESCSSDEENYIPAEVVREFNLKRDHVIVQREELRRRLKSSFAQMCVSHRSPINQ